MTAPSKVDLRVPSIHDKHMYVYGSKVRVGSTMCKLLRALLLNIGSPVESAELLKLATKPDSNYIPSSNIIQVYMARLRKHVDPHGTCPGIIKCIRNQGYIIDEAWLSDETLESITETIKAELSANFSPNEEGAQADGDD